MNTENQISELDNSTDENTPKKKVTLGEHAALWLADNKTVKFKPWTGKAERLMSKVLHDGRKSMEGGKVCRRVTLYLQFMCTEIAGKQFWKRDDDGNYKECCSQAEREYHLRSMYQADVLTAYFLMRIAGVDPEYNCTYVSPLDIDGKRECKWVGNLEDLEFKNDPTDDLEFEYEFKSPVRIRGKECSKVILGPAPWALAEDLKILNPGAVNLKLIAASIVCVPDISTERGIPFDETDLDEVPKRELNELEDIIGKKHKGLDMEVEVWDPEAEEFFQSSINWMDPDFLGGSSQS